MLFVDYNPLIKLEPVRNSVVESRVEIKSQQRTVVDDFYLRPRRIAQHSFLLVWNTTGAHKREWWQTDV